MEGLTLLLVASCVTSMVAKGTTVGSEFLVMTPPLSGPYDPDATLPYAVFCLMSAPDESAFRSNLPSIYNITTKHTEKHPQSLVEVFVTTPWFEVNGGLIVDLVLYAMKAETVMVGKRYLNKAKLGKTWTFRFLGNGYFTVSVLMVDSLESVATFLALPVASWGKKYFAVTLASSISIQIFTSDGPNTISCQLRLASKSLKLQYSSRVYKDRSYLNLQLEAREGFTITTCGNSSRYGDATGTHITGIKQFGVIVGSCEGKTSRRQCSEGISYHEKPSYDVVAEMLMPMETYGTEFITMKTEGRNGSALSYIVLASHDFTQVKFYLTDSSAEIYTLTNRGAHILADFNKRGSLVTTNQSVQIMCVQDSSCHLSPEELGDASFCLLVPTQLFYFQYFFSSNYSADSTLTSSNYVLLVVNPLFQKYLFLDDENVDQRVWNTVIGSKVWIFASVKLKPGPHFMHSVLKQPFGCYVYGHDRSTSFMHPAGYIVAPINEVCEWTSASMRAGDLTDNDCDRRIDEEILDNKDNDGDGLYDEDLASLTDEETKLYTEIQETNVEAVDGSWSSWNEWHCSNNCSDTSMYRERFCDTPRPMHGGRPCSGDKGDQKNGHCYTGDTKCPSECPDFSWGPNCSYHCHKCMEPCDKFIGACSRCSRGYKYPGQGCVKRCDPFEYGENCLQSCLEKCQDDCANHETGDCHSQFDGDEESEDLSSWTDWSCSKNCLDPSMYRQRVCQSVDNICPEPHTDMKDGRCYIGAVCPKDCPKLQWSVNCTETCVNCQDDCEKFTGVCGECKPGFKYPEDGCHDRCGINQYGVNCEGVCETKCGEDCINRITGQCRVNYLKYLAFTPGLLLLIPCYYYYSQRKKMSEGERGSLSSFVQFLLLPRSTEQERVYPYGTPVDKEEWLPTSVVHSASMATEFTETTTTETADDSRASSEVTQNDDAETQVTYAKIKRLFELRPEIKRPAVEEKPASRKSSILRTSSSGRSGTGRFKRTVTFARQNAKRIMSSVAPQKGREAPQDLPQKYAAPNGESDRRSSIRTPQTEGNSGGSQVQGERRASQLPQPENRGALGSNKTMLSPEQEKPGQKPRRDSYMSQGSIYIGE